jgi:riboflavin synthase
VIQEISRGSGGFEVGIACPREFMRFIAPKGSIAVDGMSLTVASVNRSGFAVALIPHTLKNTIAAGYRRGTRVNLEMDIVARYVQRLAGAD